MKRKLILPSVLVLLVWALLFSCSKYKNSTDDLNGNSYLRGRVFLFNDFTNDGTYKLLPGLSVQMRTASDLSGGYLYSVNSDSNGYFIFPNLKDNIPYVIMATDSVAGLQYKAFTTTTLNGNRDTSTLILYADSTVQNGLAITVTDSTNAIIGNCTCCVYNSAYLAQQDSCSGSLFQLVTNTFGKAAAFNIHATTYYTHCQAKFGNIVLKGIDTTVVDKARIKKRTIVLLTH